MIKNCTCGKKIAYYSLRCKSCANRFRAGKYRNKGGWHHTPEAKMKNRLAVLGIKRSAETKKKLSEATKKRFQDPIQLETMRAWVRKFLSKPENHWNWQGGITSENQRIRGRLEYKIWREKVFVRDNYTCQDCHERRGGTLNAHHIKAFSQYPKLRLEVSNGITLCEECHRKTDNFAGRALKENNLSVYGTK